MSVRNIRSHQARGLLAPPEVRSRVGYYGPEHVAQLRLIRDLQEEGFNLNGIKRLLDDTHGTAERLLRVRQALTASAQGRARPRPTRQSSWVSASSSSPRRAGRSSARRSRWAC